MRNLIKKRNFYIMLGIDAAIVAASFVLAFLFRFDLSLPAKEEELLLRTLPLVLVVKLPCFSLVRMYKGMWRYTSLRDVFNVAKGVTLASLVLVSWLVLYHRFEGYPRSIFAIDWVLTLVLAAGVRAAVRIYFARKATLSGGAERIGSAGELSRKRVIMVGAGDAGEKVLREILDNPRLPYKVVGIVDDDPYKKGLSIHDVPVIGAISELGGLVERKQAHEVLIAVPSATGDEMRRIVSLCEGCGVEYKTLPGIGELIDGRVSVKSLRDVKYEDLLGRAPVELDLSGIHAYLKDRVVLVTGAGGSIGSEICRQLVRFGPDTLVLVDAGESNLYSIQMELKHQVGYLRYATVLGQIQNRELMRRIFQKYRPEVVLHAAAYKHVPMLERNPWEAVTNNIVGSKVLMQTAAEQGAAKFVMISTDKAVRPTSIMGASKRFCELMLSAYQGNGTAFMAVRFGNVVGSAGSVIPLFREQIARGGPITVTHPEITRFFMTIPEACRLVLQAGALGNGGETFILDMGVPVRIVDIAKDLIRLSGKEPEKDIKITFTGLRQGEKLYEELITEGEGIVRTQHEKIMVLRAEHDGRLEGLPYATYLEWVEAQVGELVALAERQDGCGIRAKLKEIMPEYAVRDGECVI